MDYLIRRELSFFDEPARHLKLNGPEFLVNSILSKIPEQRYGRFPSKFIRLNNFQAGTSNRRSFKGKVLSALRKLKKRI